MVSSSLAILSDSEEGISIWIHGWDVSNYPVWLKISLRAKWKNETMTISSLGNFSRFWDRLQAIQLATLNTAVERRACTCTA